LEAGAVKVLVTGASGFIGAHVTRALLARGHSVAVLVRPASALQRLREVRRSIRVVTGDLGDAEALRPTLSDFRPEGCIHLAWHAEPGAYLHAAENIQSLTASLSLFGELIGAGCRQIVGAGTCFEYDTATGCLNEESPVRPQSLYASAKLACCLMGLQIAARAGARFAWGRIFYPYGPEEDERRLVPAAIRALTRGAPFPTTTGEQVRDYIHVADVAAAFCALLEKGGDGIFNVCSGHAVPVRRVVATIAELIGRPDLVQFGALPGRAWEPPVIRGDNARLRSLGWQPRYPLAQGLKETIREYAGAELTPRVYAGREIFAPNLAAGL
jgi:nucleoside-diphosphate-sugar epimerase